MLESMSVNILFTIKYLKNYFYVGILALAALAIGALTVTTSNPARAESSSDTLSAPHGDPPDYKVYHVKPGVDFHYWSAPYSRTFRFLPEDLSEYCRVTFRRDKLPAMIEMAVGTGLLVAYDQQITDEAQRFGRRIGLKTTNKQKPLTHWSVKINGTKVPLTLNFPTDISSSLYFIGDGITHLTIAFGLWSYGGISGDKRAYRTGAELIEAIACTGTIVQILKHATSRESPQVTTAHGGVWRPGTSIAEYGRHIPKYDAFPTGHLATAMATVTVIADNYPDKPLIRPIGYGLMTILGFAMLNNGVHWASDYPLGISIGYTFAKIADRHSYSVVSDPKQTGTRDEHLFETAQLTPTIMDRGEVGMRLGFDPGDVVKAGRWAWVRLENIP